MAGTITQRPAAVQAGVDAFLEEHKEALRRIHALEPQEQEREFAALMDREMDRISKMAPQSVEKELATSVAVALETDRILGLDSQRQQKVIAEKYGLDPKALVDHYPELQTKAVRLQKELTAADRNTTIMGWAAFLGTLAATLIPFSFGGTKRSIGDRFSIGNKFIKWFFVPLASLAIGFASSFVGSRFFGGKVKKESQELVTQSRIALEREIVDAIRNKVQEGVTPQPASPTPEAPASGFITGTERKAPLTAREGYVAEATKEKAAAQAAATAIG